MKAKMKFQKIKEMAVDNYLYRLLLKKEVSLVRSI